VWLDGGVAGDEAERPVEFDAWVASRSAALTRFAYLLTGNEPAAEHVLGSALVNACASWSRVRRADDPEAEVLRLVVEAHLSQAGPFRRRKTPPTAVPADRLAGDHPRSIDEAAMAWRLCATFLPPPQRAAVVLRCYAEMTYPQIAAALGGKESTARAQIQGTFDALRHSIPESRTDDELEAMFRDAFTEHADDPSVPDGRAALAHAGVRRRRRRQVVVAATITALLVGTVGGVAVTYRGGGPVAVEKPGAHPRGWRAESYNGIQLWVPSSWGWGEVPRRTTHRLVSCGVVAYSPTVVTADLRYVLMGCAFPPYVGRPVAPGAACPPPPPTSATHVWFDSPLPTGSGPVQTTVTVRGLTPFNITVADANQVERKMILRSVEPVFIDANGCPRDSAGTRKLESLAQPEPSPRFVRTLSLCLFAASRSNREVLFYSTCVEGPAARQATSRIEAAPARGSADVCLVTPALNEVVLIAHTPTAPSVFGVNPGTCPEDPVGYVTGSSFQVLTRQSVRLWAIDGLSLYASAGSASDRLTPYLPDP